MAKENYGGSMMGYHGICTVACDRAMQINTLSASSCSSSSSSSSSSSKGVDDHSESAHIVSTCQSSQMKSFLTSELQTLSHIPSSSCSESTDDYSMSVQDSGESGWTTYFDWNASDASSVNIEEEEEASLVSDASSGPPHPVKIDQQPNRKLNSHSHHNNITNYDFAESPLRSLEDIRPKKKLKFSTKSDNEDTATSSCSSDPIKHRLELLQTLIPNGHQLNEEETVQVALDYVRVLELRVKMLKRLDYYFNKLR